MFVQREDAVDNFRAGKTWVLIATDVIARGMDFKGINCVINYDFPESAAAYIHRIGNTLHLNSVPFLLMSASDCFWLHVSSVHQPFCQPACLSSHGHHL